MYCLYFTSFSLIPIWLWFVHIKQILKICFVLCSGSIFFVYEQYHNKYCTHVIHGFSEKNCLLFHGKPRPRPSTTFVVCTPMVAVLVLYCYYISIGLQGSIYLLLFGNCRFPRDHDYGVYCKVHRHGFGGVFRIAKYGPEYAFATRGQYSCGSVEIVHPAGQRFLERWRYCGKTTVEFCDYSTPLPPPP